MLRSLLCSHKRSPFRAIINQTILKRNYAAIFRSVITVKGEEVEKNRQAITTTNPSFQSIVATINLLRKEDGCDFDRVYETPSHKKLYDLLCNLAHNLHSGRYIGQCGLSSGTIVGPRGIGKTTTFVTFVNLCQVFYPNVIPVYVNYSRVLSNKRLMNFSLLELVLDELKQLGLATESPTNDEKDDIVFHLTALLERENKYVLLIVDEVDKFYEVNPNQKNNDVRKLIETFGELSGIGDDRSGRVATLLCGSSGVLPLLVNANAKVNEGYLHHPVQFQLL